ncbi:MAG: hypothetical protein WC866_06255 [Patescibacteria group bacterium]|jgi:hypothetical protein
MTIAVGILLFVCALLSLYQAGRSHYGRRILLYVLFAGFNIAAGVMSIVSDAQSVQIGVGVLLAVWTIIAIVLLIWAVGVSDGGQGLGFLVLAAALVFFAWVTVFMVLQFSIVV